jgi:hypothetical protein
MTPLKALRGWHRQWSQSADSEHRRIINYNGRSCDSQTTIMKPPNCCVPTHTKKLISAQWSTTSMAKSQFMTDKAVIHNNGEFFDIETSFKENHVRLSFIGCKANNCSAFSLQLRRLKTIHDCKFVTLVVKFFLFEYHIEPFSFII